VKSYLEILDLQDDLLQPEVNITDPHLLVLGKENHHYAADMQPELFK
jgi:hypothetical protein